MVFKRISIHAPVKGATPNKRPLKPMLDNFNPRPREGSDDKAIALAVSQLISIHAPVKGATQ